MRLIDADYLKEKGHYDDYDEFVVDYDDIKNAPTVDPVKHGRWIVEEINPNIFKVTCSVCDNWDYFGTVSEVANYAYCPYCGSRNEVDGNDCY